jgi:uncharacterized membrane protein
VGAAAASSDEDDHGLRPVARRSVHRLASSISRRCRYTLPGLGVGLLFAALSSTPSLLPRPPLFQAVVAGAAAAIGYGLGVVGAWIWREFADRGPRGPTTLAWRRFAVAATSTMVVALLLGMRWQRHSAALIGTSP